MPWPLVWVPYPVNSFLYFVISVNRVWHGKGSQVGNLTLGMSHSSQNVSIHLLSSKYNCLSVFLVIYKTSTFYMHQKYLQIALLLTRRSTFSLCRKVGDWEIFFGNFVDLCPLKSSWIWQKNLSKCLEFYTRVNNWYVTFLFCQFCSSQRPVGNIYSNTKMITLHVPSIFC